jgi:D-glycero-D-manno-heptose 1,7-bisphosphate phosphatase
VHRIEDFEWCEGAIDAIRFLNAKGYLVIVVTNQSGIGRGLYTLDDFLVLSRWVLAEADRLGATINALYYCPHHPDDLCPARKPGTGMLDAADADFGVEHTHSFLVGDRQTDLEAAAAFGIKGILYSGGDLLCVAQQALTRNC